LQLDGGVAGFVSFGKESQDDEGGHRGSVYILWTPTVPTETQPLDHLLGAFGPLSPPCGPP
jgi:hypothetical protein